LSAALRTGRPTMADGLWPVFGDRCWRLRDILWRKYKFASAFGLMPVLPISWREDWSGGFQVFWVFDPGRPSPVPVNPWMA